MGGARDVRAAVTSLLSRVRVQLVTLWKDLKPQSGAASTDVADI